MSAEFRRRVRHEVRADEVRVGDRILRRSEGGRLARVDAVRVIPARRGRAAVVAAGEQRGWYQQGILTARPDEVVEVWR